MQALQRYARFYGLKVDDAYEQADLAALVARHFDASLEVEEHESIATFIQRLRNGERSTTKRQVDKERKAAAAADKKRKKSNSRKRQRDASVSVGNSNSASANGASGGGQSGHSAGASNGHAGSANGASSGGGAHHHHQSHGSASTASSSSSHHHHDKAAATTASSSSASSSSTASKPTKRNSGASKKKDNDNEDNELYCICNLPSYGNMIACDGKKCPNPSQWYHLECVGLADGRHPDTWLCPECDPKGFAAFQSKKKKTKHRSKSPGAK